MYVGYHNCNDISCQTNTCMSLFLCKQKYNVNRYVYISCDVQLFIAITVVIVKHFT